MDHFTHPWWEFFSWAQLVMIIHLGTVSVHFCRVKQGKRLSGFLQKYTDSGTETTYLAGYNILLFKYVKNLCGLASTFYGGNSRKKLKIRYCIIWRCLHLMFSTTNVSNKGNVQGSERMLSYEQYSEEKSRLWSSSLKKKNYQPSWGITRRNYKHIPQIVCTSSRFQVLHLLSWEFERSEVLWRYNVILVCHLKHVKVAWPTRHYPHTGHLSWACTLSRWHDAVFLHEVSKTRNGHFSIYRQISAHFK